MKRLLPLIAIGILATQLAYGQLPPGSQAPNWTMADINGVSHTLYDYLNQEKVVYLDFSATWCGPCWNYHNSGALENLYDTYGPQGTNNVMVFMIEGDAATNTACLYGLPTCVGGTQGNWVAGTPYPIIDNASQNGPYAINYFPTIYGVCPDKTIFEVGQVQTPQLWEFAGGCSAPTMAPQSVVDVNCFGESTGAITISTTGGISPFTFAWSNGATTQNLSNIPAGAYTVTVTGSLGGTKTLGPITVNQPPAPVSASVANVTPASCAGIGGSVDITVSGGTPGYNFLWSNGYTTQNLFNVPAGTYSVTATDLNGCSTDINGIVVAPPTIPTAAASAPSALNCNNPTVTLSGEGTSTGSNFTYVWTTTNGNIVSGHLTLNDCVVDAPGTYQLLVLDNANACSATASTTVTSNIALPSASAGSGGTVTCTQSQITLNGSGSTGSNIAYLWTTSGGNIVSGATTLNPVVNAGGTYTLTVTNTSNGCTATSSTSVTGNNAAPGATAEGGEITCTASSVQLSGSSATSGVNYAWTGPGGYTSNQQNPTVSAAGNYTLTVTNPANGCTSTDPATVVLNTAQPQASAQGGTLTCAATSVNLNGSSSTAGATFAWSGPNGYSSNEQSPTVNAAGNYVLTVTGPNGCTQDATAIVNLNTTLPTANAGANGVLNCNTSSLVLNGTGSSSGNQFSYEWSTTNGNIVSGENSLTPTVDAVGTYTLTVTNSNNGCTNTDDSQVTQSPPVTAEILAVSNILCNGNSTGSATVEAGGGNGVYSYAWSNGATSETASNLSAGTYSVTVTDGENCSSAETVTITQPSAIAVNATATAQSAPGVNDGSATANPAGGTGVYTYAWSNGETSQSITDLAPGSYTVSVTDENGCVRTQTVTVNAFGCALAANASGVDVTCNGANDGSATVVLNNAAQPYTYEWSNGETTEEITGLAPGTYTVTASDANSCDVVVSVEILQPAVLNANTTSTAVTAAGASDGTATANPTGGTAPFTYEWSNGETTQTITGLSSANYTVTVTDLNGCTAVQTVPVAPFGCVMFANISANNISCNGANDGQATVTLSNGLSPFTYEWSNEANAATINNLSAGTYTVTVSDAVNCPAIAEVTILEPSTLSVEVTEFANADCGSENGLASVVAIGGTPAYAYAWSNGETTPSISNLEPGTYTVSVTDLNDCATTLEVEISVDDTEAPVASAQNMTLVLDGNGEASLSASEVDNGSSDNCNIAGMSVNQTSFTCDDLGEHEITLTVTDEAGNSSTATATVTIIDNKLPVIIIEDVVVNLDENGQAIITPEMLDNGSSDNCGIAGMSVDVAAFGCDNLGANAVVLTVTDASGNSASGTAIVTVQDKMAPAIECPANMVLPYCDPVGTYEVTAKDNCSDNLAYQWTGPASGSTFPTGETAVKVVVSDQNGNSATCSFTVTVPVAMDVNMAVLPGSCVGANDGKATATITGGTPGYTYLWSTGATTPSIENLSAGAYSLTVTDEAGCQETESFFITEPTVLFTNVVSIQPETGNDKNGSIDVSVTGGTEPYTYKWLNAAGEVISTEQDVTGLSAGTYTLIVTDANGCEATHVFTVQSVTSVLSRQLESSINLYPNPTSGFVTMALEDISTPEVDITVFDMNGKMAARFPHRDMATGKLTFDLSAQASGVYLVRVVIENQVVTKRLVINR